MTKRRPNPVSDCPLTAAIAAVGGKWKLLIIYWLAESPKRFAALREVMSGISQKVLTEQLRELIDDDIVRREQAGPAPAPSIYSLTEHGHAMMPIVEAARTCGRTHITHLGE